jgi:hypothetical protein
MAKPIDRIRAKVTRAILHVEDFELAIGAFYRSRPYTVGVKEDTERGKRVYFLAGIAEVPLNVESIAADALGNLREALDHVAYQLELAGCGAPPKQHVYFPIADSAADYPALRDRYIKCAGQSAIDAIDATEPYQGGKGHGLWQLNALKKVDKHHLLIAAGTISMGIDIVAGTYRKFPEWAREAWRNMPPLFIREVGPPLKAGDELYIESLDEEMEQDRKFAFEVAFDRPGVVESEPALKTLQDLTNLLDGLVTSFEPLFL